MRTTRYTAFNSDDDGFEERKEANSIVAQNFKAFLAQQEQELIKRYPGFLVDFKAWLKTEIKIKPKEKII